MPSESPLPVHFSAKDIISAQRLRFIKSSRIKILLLFWALLTAFLLVQLIFPGVFQGLTFASWGLLIGLALAFLLVVALFYWLAPWMDYHQNPLWQTAFTLQMNEQYLFLSMEGKTKGVTVHWERIRKMDENERAYILYLNTEANFLILPKSVFASPNAQIRFCNFLKTKSALPEKVKLRLGEVG